MTDHYHLTVVTYHYVRDMHRTSYPNIKGLLIEKFKGQLDYLCKHYSMIQYYELLDFLRGSKGLPDKACVLTFDDGFKDHFVTVYPLLKQRCLTGIFFPITQPSLERQVATVHKIHFLLAKLGSKLLADRFFEQLDRDYPGSGYSREKLDTEIQVPRSFDDQETAFLKAALTYVIPKQIREPILTSLFQRYIGDEYQFCNDLYMDIPEMLEMVSAGMIFGAHSKTHPPLTVLGEEDQKQEIEACYDLLGWLYDTPRGFLPFAYPYGAYNDRICKLLQANGFACAFTARPDIRQCRSAPFEIGRLDTNDLPFSADAPISEWTIKAMSAQAKGMSAG